MTEPTKFVLPDGDFADRAARIDRERDPAARREKQERAVERAEAEEQAVALVKRYYVLVSRTRDGRFLASTLDHPPLVGPLHAVGRDEQHVLREIRFAYASALCRRKLLPTMAECRRHALTAEFVARQVGSDIKVAVL